MARRRKPPQITQMPTLSQDSSELNEWIENLPSTFIGCRDFGHVWQALTAHWDPDHNSFTRQQRCRRCKTYRTQSLGANGSIDNNRYTHAEGYRAPAGAGRWDKDARAALRLTATLRMIQD